MAKHELCEVATAFRLKDGCEAIELDAYLQQGVATAFRLKSGCEETKTLEDAKEGVATAFRLKDGCEEAEEAAFAKFYESQPPFG